MLKAIHGEFNDLLPQSLRRKIGWPSRDSRMKRGHRHGPEVYVPVNHTVVREVIEIVQRDTPKG